jgi:predicted acylesterase/phospholipase RssA/CRP-like cAMP-binding protein
MTGVRKSWTPLQDQQVLKQHCALLAHLDESELEQLIRDARPVEIAAGDPVFVSGQATDKAFIVLSGRLAVLFTRDWGEPRIIDEVGRGGMVGEIELLNGDKCMADVRTLEDCRLLCMSKTTFECLMAEHPSVWREVSELARKRTCRLLMTRQISELFGTARTKISDPLLRLDAEEEWLNFEQKVLHKLEDRIDWIRLGRGEYLFLQGDRPDGAYVLVSGLLGVNVTDGAIGQHEIARIRQGEIVGELALIMDAKRSASVVALRDSELFRLSPDVFAAVSERYPRRLVNVYGTITERFYKNVSGVARRIRSSNIAFMTASADVPLSEFTRELLGRLARHTEIEHLTSRSVDQALGRVGAANSSENELENDRLVQWLNGRDSESGLVVFQGDTEWSNWNHRCLRQSDSLYVVADARGDPDLTSAISQATEIAQKWSLVLLHPQHTDRPRSSARWLNDERFSAIYHVRQNNKQDMARLARIIGGRAVGLVLGGGGARGFAHLGVLKALEEQGVPVDMIGGTSIGAPISGWIAQGKNAKEILDLTINAFKSLIDITLPITSMISGKRISSVIFRETAEWDIEDYWLPFFCVSTNLTTFKPRIHRRGNSAHAIRASVSIPGVLPPVPDAGELLVDGGVLNNLPIDVMRRMNPDGIVIAIDVVAEQGLKAREDYGHSLSGWRSLLGKFGPWWNAPKAPPIASILMQSVMVGSSHARERMLQLGLADYYQNINVQGIGLLQFENAQEAAAIGYEQSIEPLKKWVASMKDRGQRKMVSDGSVSSSQA